jgi:threonine dehydrogenase-like Zn-dependent dehydrogenase
VSSLTTGAMGLSGTIPAFLVLRFVGGAAMIDDTLPVAIIGAGPIGLAAACCGGPAPADVEACCADDAEAKAAGETGCGCPTPPTTEPVTAACCAR